MKAKTTRAEREKRFELVKKLLKSGAKVSLAAETLEVSRNTVQKMGRFETYQEYLDWTKEVTASRKLSTQLVTQTPPEESPENTQHGKDLSVLASAISTLIEATKEQTKILEAIREEVANPKANTRFCAWKVR